jgi:Uma2 family endonuclease
MLAIADHPPLTKQELIKRWEEVLDRYSDLYIGQMELDSHGNLLMSPPPSEWHQTQAEWISQYLNLILPSWTVLQNIGVLTGSVVQQPDVLAASWKRSKAEGKKPFDPAPEICVEVLSPSNSRSLMKQKQKLYLRAGAKEIWFCDDKNRMSFFTAQGQIERSEIAPGFPLDVHLAVLPILKLQQELQIRDRVIVETYDSIVKTPEDRKRLELHNANLVAAYDTIITTQNMTTRDRNAPGEA